MENNIRMSIEDFQDHDWANSEYHYVIYKDFRFAIVAIDTEESLIGVRDGQNDDEISYKRCENCIFCK